MENQIIKKVYDGIPLLECNPDQGVKYQGVFFLIHGHTCSKELYYFGSLPERLTKLGFLVVSIDAYKHGDRKEEPYFSGMDYEKVMTMAEIVNITPKEISNLYIKYYHKNGGKLGFLGISMGGHIVFQMPKFLTNIDMLIPLIGAPDMRRHYQEMKLEVLGNERMELLEPLFSELTIPVTAYQFSTRVLILEGINDNIVSYKNAYDFYCLLHSKGYSNIFYQEFPVGHVVTPEMENVVEQFINKNLD